VAAQQMSEQRIARVLELDPDLGSGLAREEWPAATQAVLGVLDEHAPGPWEPSVDLGDRLAGLIVGGLLVSHLALSETTSAELLTAGDVLLPDACPPVSFLTARADCLVLEPVQVVWLGSNFERAACRWPQLSRALMQRVHWRARRAALLQTIGQLTRIDDRVLVLLWHLAERFGRVGGDGVVVPVRLTHRTIARLVGARRPSVTTAISALQRRRIVERRADGAWVLHERPAVEVGVMTSSLHAGAAGARAG
jgi:CRP/FNR family transcriptional regulator, cyclic AMP receptor protein